MLWTYGLWALVAARADLPTACPFRLVTGRRCPFCGLTRATGHALAGRLRESRRRHPLGVLVGLAVAADVLAAAGRHPRRRRQNSNTSAHWNARWALSAAPPCPPSTFS